MPGSYKKKQFVLLTDGCFLTQALERNIELLGRGVVRRTLTPCMLLVKKM